MLKLHQFVCYSRCAAVTSPSSAAAKCSCCPWKLCTKEEWSNTLKIACAFNNIFFERVCIPDFFSLHLFHSHIMWTRDMPVGAAVCFSIVGIWDLTLHMVSMISWKFWKKTSLAFAMDRNVIYHSDNKYYFCICIKWIRICAICWCWLKEMNLKCVTNRSMELDECCCVAIWSKLIFIEFFSERFSSRSAEYSQFPC